MAAPHTWVELARIGRPHGLQGAFFLRELRPHAELLAVGLAVRISVDSAESRQAKDATITFLSTEAKSCRLKVSCFADRTALEAYVGAKIFALAAEEDLGPVDCEVYDAAGLLFGTVSKVVNYGASDILIIKGAEGFVDIPFIPNYFGPLEGRRLTLLVPADTFAEFWHQGE